MTIKETLQRTVEKLDRAGVITARLDAELLLATVLHKGRAWVFTHDSDRIDGKTLALFEGLVDRRARREPLQYIVGSQEFWGLDFIVTPDVLIPRPETEFVVAAALQDLKASSGEKTIIDLCTGTGCIAICLAKEIDGARTFAVDASGKALGVARKNALLHNVAERVTFLEGDLFAPLKELALQGAADVITANPPYVPAADKPSLQPEVRDYEPSIALFAGPEGIEISRRIIETAPTFLKNGGALIMEMGIGQTQKLAAIVDGTGAYGAPDIVKDLAGIDRVIIVKRK